MHINLCAHNILTPHPARSCSLHNCDFIGDDFYTRTSSKRRWYTAFIVFTCYKTRAPHYESSDEMGDDAPLVSPGSIDMREIFKVEKKDQFQFREYAWAGGDDVNAELENKAVQVTCEKMGWDMPANWRQLRNKQSSAARRVGLAPIWDLVEDVPTGPNLHRSQESPQAAGQIPGIRSCYNIQPGDDIGAAIANMFGDIHQRPKDHLAAWKEKNSM